MCINQNDDVSIINALLKWTVLWMSLLLSSLVFSHGGDEHPPIEAEEAKRAALKAAEYFTTQDMGLGFGKLNKSWANLPADAAQIHREQDGYFIVVVTHAATGKKLYVLMSNSGDIYDANYNGEFAKLK